MTETASTYNSLEIKPGWYLLLAKRVERVLEKRLDPLFLLSASNSLCLMLHESQFAGSQSFSPSVFCWNVRVALPTPLHKKVSFLLVYLTLTSLLRPRLLL